MLIRMIRMQFFLMIQKKTFQISFGIALLYVIATYLFYCFRYSGSDLSNIMSASSLFAGNSSTIIANFLSVLFPFLAIFPFAFSFLTDKSIKILPIVQSKCGSKTYYISKMIMCFIGGFILFFIPFLTSIILNQITFPLQGSTLWGALYDWNYSNDITGKNVIVNAAGYGLPFLKLYLYNPLLYNLLYTFIFSFFIAILSVFAYAVSFLVKQYKIFLLIPVYVIIYGFNALTYMLDTDGSTKFYRFFVFDYITVDTGYGKSPFFFIPLSLALIVSSVFLIIKQAMADQLL